MVIPDSLKKAFDFCTEYLEKAGADAPAFEVEVLLEDLLGLPKGNVLFNPDSVLTEEQLSVLKSAVKKRASGYPLQYIVGNWDFYGRKFFCGEGVLIPRAETELLCEEVLGFFRGKKPRAVDLCSGSGCVAITLAKELPGSEITAVELYPEAFCYLKRNNEYYKSPVEAVLGDALSPFGSFDCVVSNPPYVAEGELSSLQKEVGFEPKTSLCGGEDGLFFYREIAKKWASHIVSGGLIAFETGETQGEAVSEILSENGFGSVKVRRDYACLDRIVTGIKE